MILNSPFRLAARNPKPQPLSLWIGGSMYYELVQGEGDRVLYVNMRNNLTQLQEKFYTTEAFVSCYNDNFENEGEVGHEQVDMIVNGFHSWYPEPSEFEIF